MFSPVSGQEDLLSMLDTMETRQETSHEVLGVYNSTRLINGYTTETVGQKELVFSISHRFGNLSASNSIMGLDQASIRFGFDYGLTDKLNIGIGRNSHEKLYDGFIKYKLVNQKTGSKSFPVSIAILEGIAVKTADWARQNREYPFTARLFYTHELLISRKFNQNFSLQLSPLLVHRNMVEKKEDQNLVPAIGAGGKHKIYKQIYVTGEYFALFPGHTATNYHNPLAIGLEIVAGGHVFQLHFTNSTGMTEKHLVPETVGKWLDGDIRFGFNIIRLFDLDN
jgi:hypothetical protein